LPFTCCSGASIRLIFEHELASMDCVLADRLANTLLDGIDWDGIDWS
jgi:hypothetical protein